MDLVLQFSDDKEGRTALLVLQEDLTRRLVPGLVKYSVVYPQRSASNGAAKKLTGDGSKQLGRGPVIQAIFSRVGQQFTYADAVKAAKGGGFTSKSSVDNVLSRLKKRGKVRSIGKALYEVVT